MAHYVQLMTLTPDGRERMAADPHHMLDVRSSIEMEGVETLGLYAVLGQYDFVGLVQAPRQRHSRPLLPCAGSAGGRAHRYAARRTRRRL